MDLLFCVAVGCLSDVLLSRAGSQREHRRQVEFHWEHGDCGVGTQPWPHEPKSCWTVGDNNHHTGGPDINK